MSIFGSYSDHLKIMVKTLMASGKNLFISRSQSLIYYVDDFFLVLHCIWLALSLSTFKFVENSFTLRIATFGNKNVCNDRYVCWIGTTFDFESNGKFICLLQTFYAKYRYTYILKDKKNSIRKCIFSPHLSSKKT